MSKFLPVSFLDFYNCVLSNFLFVPSGNGYITTEQLREILWELDNTITASDMDNIIDEIDADDSGTVDFEGTLLYGTAAARRVGHPSCAAGRLPGLAARAQSMAPSPSTS